MKGLLKIGAILLILAVPTAQGSPAVGKLGGSLRVANGGEANYTIPLRALPVGNGFHSPVSLVYENGSGQSFLGKDWTLSGLSSIVRCKATVFHDGYNHRSDLSDKDRFCLDGQKLVVVKGEYGADQSEYRTYRDSFAKVVALGQWGTGPEKFRVYRKDGTIEEYGATENARIANDRGVAVWALGSRSDRFTNTISYSYLAQNDGATLLYPDTIRFGGNIRAGLQGYSQYRFKYRDKQPLQKYIATIPVSETKQLYQIDLVNGDRTIYQYALSYETVPSTPVPLLSAIELCAFDKSCLPPKRFSYEDASSPVSSDYIKEVPGLSFLKNDDYNIRKAVVRMADFNQDGFDDVFVMNDQPLSSMRIAYGDGTTFSEPKVQNWKITEWWSAKKDLVDITDLDNDGYPDLVMFFKDKQRIAYGSNEGFQEYADFEINHMGLSNSRHRGLRNRYIQDYNGDGVKDILAYTKEKAYLALGTADRETPFADVITLSDEYGYPAHGDPRRHPRSVVDLNNDGSPDLVGFSKGFKFSMNNGGKFSPAQKILPKLGNVEWLVAHSSKHFADANGDGYVDFVGFCPDGIFVALGTGSGFGPLELWLEDFREKDGFDDGRSYRLAFDINKDGLVDFLGIYDNKVRLVLGQGSSLMGKDVVRIDRSVGFSFFRGNNEQFDLTDVDQDGTFDFFVSDESRAQSVNWRVPSLRLKSITDSYGSVTSVKWATLQDSEVYQPCNTEQRNDRADLIAIAGPQYVVKSVQMPDGIGGQKSLSYRYGCGRYHLQGLGFLGYSQVSEKDDLSGIATTRFFSQDVGQMTIGQIDKVEKTQSFDDGRRIALERRYYNYATVWDEKRTHYVNHNTQSLIKKYDTKNSPIATIESKSTFDVFGNLLSSRIKTKDKYATYHENSDYTYHTPDEASWLVAQVATIASELGRGEVKPLSPSRRSSRFTYDDLGAVATETTLEGSGLGLTVATLSRDAFGSVTSTEKRLENASGLPRDKLPGPTTEYDVRGFLIASTNALGHKTSIEYDPILNLPTKNISVNGQATVTEYDAWGRIAKVSYPDERRESTSYAWCKDSTACRSDSLYIITTASNYSPTATQERDRLDRKLRTTVESYNAKTAVTDVYFDSLGRAIKESAPYFQGDAPQFNNSLYDEFHRVYSTVQADGATQSFYYDGFDIAKIDAKGNKTLVTKNALGQKLTVTQWDKFAGHEAKVTFGYNERGLLASVTDSDGATISYDYNDLDRKVRTHDPDFGSSSTLYNSLGLPYEIVTADGQTIRKSYDLLGRPIATKVSKPGLADHISTTIYDSAAHGIGAIHKETTPLHQVVYSYDGLTRLRAITDQVRDQESVTQMDYDSKSRIVKKRYSDGFGLRYSYDERGHLREVADLDTKDVYQQIAEVNALGQVTRSMQAHGVEVSRKFDPVYGNLLGVKAAAQGSEIFNQSYTYDLARNLTGRKDILSGLSDSFEYDDFHRLVEANSSRFGKESFRYRVNGNIHSRNKDGKESFYSYGSECASGTKRFRHGVCEVQHNSRGVVAYNSYDYDNAGRVVGISDGRKIGYNILGQTEVISRHDAAGLEQSATYFYYGVGGRNIERVDTTGSVAVTTTRLASDFEQIESKAGSVSRHTIGNTVVKISAKGSREVYNLFKDQIGSVVKVTDSAHKMAKEEVFDAFGKRQVDSDIWGGDVATTATLAGFTAHQQIDSAGLIHMGGRLYDPALGRFLAPDPFIQNPQNQQSLNRYSYVWNNPLTHTDPSGYFVQGIIRGIGAIAKGVSNAFGRFSDWLAHNERMIYASAIKVAAIALAASTGGLGAWAIVAAGGYASGYVATNGNQRAATIGAITAVAFYGIGNGIEPDAVGIKTVSHGVVSGAAASAQGGDFASNFAAGAVNGYLNSSRLIDTFTPDFESVYGTLGYQMATSAVAGGLTSQAISGNFESGFESALTAHVFNCVEFAWDLFNVGLDVQAIGEWDDSTSFWEKGLDVGALVIDGLAAATPFVPGGAGAALKGARAARFFDDIARSATRNPSSSKLVLGHFATKGTSYQKVAAHHNATYFKVENWAAVTKGLSQDQIWKINETFLNQQLSQGKQVLFSHNPLKARPGSFFEREVKYMRELGYKFNQKNKWTWEAFR